MYRPLTKAQVQSTNLFNILYEIVEFVDSVNTSLSSQIVTILYYLSYYITRYMLRGMARHCPLSPLQGYTTVCDQVDQVDKQTHKISANYRIILSLPYKYLRFE